MVKVTSARKAIIKKLLKDISGFRKLSKLPGVPHAKKVRLKSKVDVLRDTVRVLRDLRD
jgi:hypothetical protein